MTDSTPAHEDLLWREYQQHLDSTPRSIGYTQWLIEKAASLRDQLASKDARIAALERDVERMRKAMST